MSNEGRLSIVLGANRDEVPRLAELADRFGKAHQLSADDVLRIQLVLDEVVINIIRHGYEDVGDTGPHEIDVRLDLDDRRVLRIKVIDDAREYDPRNAPSPRFDVPLAQRRAGGLGVHIVKAIMDSIDYQREDGHNILTMTKKLESQPNG